MSTFLEQWSHDIDAEREVLSSGGRSKYICVYSTSDKVLLRRFELTLNRSLDGVHDELNTKNMTDAGPLDLITDAASDDELGVAGLQGEQLHVCRLQYPCATCWLR